MIHQPYEEWLFSQDSLTPEEVTALQVHLRSCEACNRLNLAWNSVVVELDKTAPVEPKTGFTLRWQQRLEAEQQRLYRRQSLALLIFSIAGALLLFGSLALLFLPSLQPPKVLLWVWLYQLVGLLAAADITHSFLLTLSRTVFGGIIPLTGWVLFVGLLTELGVLWVVSLRLLTKPRRVA